MPSKSIYFAFFIGTSLVLIAAQLLVYFQLRRILRRDFPEWSKKRMHGIRWFFLAMNIPLVFLLFRNDLKFDTSTLTVLLLYPFTLWQFLILLWTVILIPVTLIRIITKLVTSDG